MSRPRWMWANAKAWLRLFVRTPRGGRGVAPAWRAPSRFAIGAIVAAAAIIATMVLFDGWAIAQARHLPSGVVNLFNELTDFGTAGWILVPAGLALAIIASVAAPTLPPALRLTLTAVAIRAGFVFFAVAVPGLVVTTLKRVIGRARPMIEGSIDPFLYRPLKWMPEYAGLPSGHACNACAAAVALGLLWPRGRPLFWAYAVVIMASRIVITSHHPSDVLAGGICGMLGALLVRDWMAARRLGFVPDGAGGIRTLSGPSWARMKRVARRLLAQ